MCEQPKRDCHLGTCQLCSNFEEELKTKLVCALYDDFMDEVNKFCKYQVALRENFKYYFADFVRKGGGVPPKSVTPYLPKILSVKGGGSTPPYP